ncbi:conserved hypothetical protein [Gloeothece citriformis PCC 7424]|uniref:DUF2811 domain-containing protein n=1 Tax=Gloeothece citriformis (strain PCC 7424) TaxID=65393 RepID=B7KA79_GLOC7|nr:DUF2811 domain-containing protein [Gloeothece citriformis]ACK72853.1 conserved hypothetical protein [Gloeothece citriformis PCC 7424]
MNTSVSILAEIPEELHESLRDYLETHPNWDVDQVFAVALSWFLLKSENAQTPQSSQMSRACARVYLETLFEQSDG